MTMRTLCARSRSRTTVNSSSPMLTSWPPAKKGWPRIAITILPREASSAARSHASCSGSTPRRTPVSIAISANAGVWIWKNGAVCVPVCTPYCRRRNAARSMNSSIRASVVLERPPSAAIRARIASARGLGFEERRHEAFERVVPVVIAGNRVQRLRHALERQPEARLVVLHRAGRIDDVRRQHHEPDVVGVGGAEQRVLEDLLAGVALAGVADDDERERLGAGEVVGRDAEAAAVERGAAAGDDGTHHGGAPGVRARRGPRVPHARRPVLRVEVPAHAPDRHRGDDDRRERQPDLQAAADGRPSANSAPRGRAGRSASATRATSGARASATRATPGSRGRVEHAQPRRGARAVASGARTKSRSGTMTK